MMARASPSRDAATNQPWTASYNRNTACLDFPGFVTKNMADLKTESDEESPTLHTHKDGLLMHQQVKTLPAGSVPISFVGEGAANAVFEIKVPDFCGKAGDFQGRFSHPPRSSR